MSPTAFQISQFAGGAHNAVVYFEIAPGDYLLTHTDSAEEVLYIVAGQGETHGDGREQVQSGDLAATPALVPRCGANTDEEHPKVVGFFGHSEIVSTFREPLQPMRLTTLTQGQPTPIQS